MMQSVSKTAQGNVVQKPKVPKFYKVIDLKGDEHYIDILSNQPVLIRIVENGKLLARTMNKVTGDYTDFKPLDNQLYRML